MDAFFPTILSANFLDPIELIEKFGTVGLFIIIFLESAFAPLPGDSLLFAAGLFAAAGNLSLPVIIVGSSIAAILGNQAGYWFGRKVGVALYDRPNSRFFKKENLDKTHAYFERFGPKTIVLARLIPVVRGLAPIVAGVGRMEYRTFVTYNIAGGIAWVVSFIMLGWFLGDAIGPEKVDKYVLPLVIAVIVITTIPLVIEYYRTKKQLAKIPVGDAMHDIADATHDIVKD
jgi:membrane-associated protein